MGGHEALVAERKRALLTGLTGTVLEIGPGCGGNLRYLESATRWIGVDPNPWFAPHVQAAPRSPSGAPASVHFVGGSGESLPLAGESVDAVLSTLVLCSVEDPTRVLTELSRILRPGGPLVLVEHVGAPPGSWLRLFQGALTPLWSRLTDGCHLDRDLEPALERAGFPPGGLEALSLPLPLVGPHRAGVVYKPGPQGPPRVG